MYRKFSVRCVTSATEKNEMELNRDNLLNIIDTLLFLTFISDILSHMFFFRYKTLQLP